MVIPGSDPERSYICDIKPYTGETFWRLRICADGETKFDTSSERRTWGKHFDWLCVRGKWDKVPCEPVQVKLEDCSDLPSDPPPNRLCAYWCLSNSPLPETGHWREATCDPEGSTKTDSTQNDHVCRQGTWQQLECELHALKHVPRDPYTSGNPYTNGEFYMCIEDAFGKKLWKQMECEPGTVWTNSDTNTEYYCCDSDTSHMDTELHCGIPGRWVAMPCEVGETWYRERDGQLFKCVESYIGPPTWWRPIDCEQEGARKSDDSGKQYVCMNGVWVPDVCDPGPPAETKMVQSPDDDKEFYEYVCESASGGPFWTRMLCQHGRPHPTFPWLICDPTGSIWQQDRDWDFRPQPVEITHLWTPAEQLKRLWDNWGVKYRPGRYPNGWPIGKPGMPGAPKPGE